MSSQDDKPLPPLRFVFDYVNPYAYIGWKLVHSVAERFGRQVEPFPVLYAALLKAYNAREADEIPAMRRYMYKDVLRTAHALDILIFPPVRDPIRSLLALRVSSLPLAPEARLLLIDGLFSAAWAGGRDISEPDEVADVANAAGLNGAEVVEAAQRPETKARLRGQTEEALAAGVFGVPTVIVGTEIFWRHDSFPHMERFLRGKDPINPARVAHWEQLRAMAATSCQEDRE